MEKDNKEAISNYGKKQKELIFSVRKSLDLETDRGACIMGCDLLDKMLEGLLRKKLIGSNKLKNELFALNGPFGNFASKVKISYSIGFLNEDIFRDIEILRDIRNKFSHSHDYMDFNSKEIKARMENLKSYISNAKKDQLRETFSNTLVNLAIQIFNSDMLSRKIKEFELPKYMTEEHKNEIIQDAIQEFKPKSK